MAVGGAEVQATQWMEFQGCLFEGWADSVLQLGCKLRKVRGVGSCVRGLGILAHPQHPPHPGLGQTFQIGQNANSAKFKSGFPCTALYWIQMSGKAGASPRPEYLPTFTSPLQLHM